MARASNGRSEGSVVPWFRHCASGMVGAAAAGVPLARRRGGTVRSGTHHPVKVGLGIPINLADHWKAIKGQGRRMCRGAEGGTRRGISGGETAPTGTLAVEQC
ncbi:MAG: hypothetical protein ACM31N_08510 [Deltaproteobacteria bacterium]